MLEKKKLLIITNRFYPDLGGAETNIFYQAKLLAKTYDVTVVTPLRDNIDLVENIDGINIKRFRDYKNRNNFYPNKRANTLCPEVFFEILFGGYDIVQCFPSLNHNNMIARVACFIRRIPIVLCVFDMLDYNHILKKTGSIPKDVIFKSKLSFIRRLFIKSFHQIFSISNNEIKYLKSFNPNVDFSPVPVLLEEYNSTPLDPREKYNLPKSNFTFFCLGRVSQLKGHDLALKAFVEFSEKYPDTQIAIIGRMDYSESFLKEYQETIKKKNLGDRIIFTDAVSREEVLGWLHHGDIHIVPVRFMNSGAVVVETWASKTPVIQSDAVDPNLVVDGKNGFCFTSEDVDDLVKKMEEAYKSKNLKEMANEGRKLVEGKFNYGYLINLYNQKFTNLINR